MAGKKHLQIDSQSRWGRCVNVRAKYQCKFQGIEHMSVTTWAMHSLTKK